MKSCCVVAIRNPYFVLFTLMALVVGCGGEASESKSPSQTEMPGLECRIEANSTVDACTGPSLSEYYCSAFGGEDVATPTDIGSQQPFWVLKDLQPQSCGYNQYYGLEAFRDKPTMIVLLWAGCGFCQAQTEMLQQMHFELKAEGVDVHFVIIDMAAQNPPIDQLTQRCDFPIFQDESNIDVWGLQGGQKDDFYFYGTDGVLQNFIGHDEDIVLTNYENPDEPTSGYLNIKRAVIDLFEGEQEEDAASDAGDSQ